MVKTGFKNILQILIILIFNNFLAHLGAQNLTENKMVNQPINRKDTVVLKKEQLESVVKTKAERIRNDIPKKMTYLNKNAQVNYQDMVIDADYISIDWDKSLIYARGEVDSIGKIKNPAKATQGGKTYEYDEFTYNIKTRQAIAFNARTEESEGVIVAEKTKKYNDSVFFMRRGKYTTDEYFIKKKDTIADYYLLAPTIKLIKGKEKSQVITGPIQLYIEQVPTPLIMPFAILPFSDKRSAGILIPSFGEREDVGFFLNSLGYYQPIGEHFDFKILTDFYTKGSWNLRPEVNYKKNYKYTGNFSADIGTTIRGIKGLDDYSKTGTYRIAWRHQQDTKANPFLTFSASVDVVSNKFYNNTVNNNYAFNQNNLNAQQNSSISVVKRFLTLPITITGTSSYSQNFSTGLADLKLPVLNVAVNQFYLFKPKTGVRQGLLENITVNTGLNLNNYVQTNEGELFTKVMWDKMQTGLRNNISLGTNTTVAKYFTFSVSANIDNALTTKTLTRTYNPISNKVEDILNKKIAGYSSFSTSASLQTVLYGMLNFKKGSAIEAVRHMITPQLGFSYSPDFSTPAFGYFKNYYNDRGEMTPYSIFDRGIIGSPNSGLVQSLNFSLNNNVEMKVRSKKDSTGVKKLKIFESLNFNTSYNFAAPIYKWSMFSFNGQTTLFEKLNLNTSLTLEPYEITFAPGQEYGVRTENFGHFSIQGFNAQLSYPLSEAIFGEKEDISKMYKAKGEIRNESYYFDEDNYARFTQPWTLNINAQYGYTKSLTRFGNSVASVGLDGSLKLTPYWNLTGNLYYDVVNKEIANTQLGFSRDQRSFTINFNWIPFGQYKVYDFFIGIKANILRDALKYKDRSFTQPNAPF
ncbi:LPS-assembly protein LptD [Chryseobacterium sp. SNU WT5]|uniref:putative LPS assembly protein LptD n=1 Tax=Chryseobacterium sp. SNU WT5 TaxID=2594269 RepID=UPI00117C61E0|nr:putative LPS assembly protein LptD [Chryseobacterium sp. SNU WT5]QDP85652.1 LPS-assembly protein LptD [Chryseobacterium sp. SNU WT5]